MIKSTADAVVIGAGIQGTSVAYYLALKSIRDIVVVETDTIGSGSSGRSVGMFVAHSFSRPRLELLRISRAEFMSFEERLGISLGLKRIGSLRLITRTLVDQIEPKAELVLPPVTNHRVLTPGEIDDVIPGLALEDVACGIYDGEDAVLDPHTVYMAHAHAARGLGVRICEGVQATGLDVDKHGIRAVRTTAGTIATRCVVNAAGASAREVGAWAGLSLLITNLIDKCN